MYAENSNNLKLAIEEQKSLTEIRDLIKKPLFIHMHDFREIVKGHPNEEDILVLLEEKGMLAIKSIDDMVERKRWLDIKNKEVIESKKVKLEVYACLNQDSIEDLRARPKVDPKKEQTLDRFSEYLADRLVCAINKMPSEQSQAYPLIEILISQIPIASQCWDLYKNDHKKYWEDIYQKQISFILGTKKQEIAKTYARHIACFFLPDIMNPDDHETNLKQDIGELIERYRPAHLAHQFFDEIKKYISGQPGKNKELIPAWDYLVDDSIAHFIYVLMKPDLLGTQKHNTSNSTDSKKPNDELTSILGSEIIKNFGEVATDYFLPTPRKTIESSFQFHQQSSAYQMALLSSIVYCNDPTICRRLGEWGLEDLDIIATNHLKAIYTKLNERTIVVFRGTHHESNWLKDIKASSAEMSHNGNIIEVHKGFFEAFTSLWKKGLENKKYSQDTLVTGHSLGGALANLMAYKLVGQQQKPVVYTFGAPKWCKKDSIDTVHHKIGKDNIFRYEHYLDIVPTLPLKDMKYEHAGQVSKIVPDSPDKRQDDNTFNLLLETQNHAMNGYIRHVGKMPTVSNTHYDFQPTSAATIKDVNQLHNAMVGNQPDRISSLLEQGADPHLKNDQGDTPLDAGVRSLSPAAIQVYLAKIPQILDTLSTLDRRIQLLEVNPNQISTFHESREKYKELKRPEKDQQPASQINSGVLVSHENKVNKYSMAANQHAMFYAKASHKPVVKSRKKSKIQLDVDGIKPCYQSD
jgi:hypothetical protein